MNIYSLVPELDRLSFLAQAIETHERRANARRCSRAPKHGDRRITAVLPGPQENRRASRNQRTDDEERFEAGASLRARPEELIFLSRDTKFLTDSHLGNEMHCVPAVLPGCPQDTRRDRSYLGGNPAPATENETPGLFSSL